MIKILITFALYGGLISRLHGLQTSLLSKSVMNVLWALPLAFWSAMIVAEYPHHEYWQVALSSFFAGAACTAGKATGHGRVWNPFSPLDLSKDPEQIEAVTSWLIGRVSDFWYKTIAMALIGLAAVSGAAIVVSFYSPLGGAIIAVGGMMKALAYIIGRKFSPNLGKHLDEPTEYGEVLTGIFAYTAMGLAVILYGVVGYVR